MHFEKPIWVNGKSAQSIAATDRGLAYGDGVFETIKVVAGQQTLEPLHWQRLACGVDRLGIKLDVIKTREESRHFLRSSGAAEAVLKIVVTRGSGGRGYNPEGVNSASRVMSLHPLPQYPSKYARDGINTKLCELRLGQSSFAGIKHLNRLEQVMARSEWQGSTYQEGLLQDFEGRVIEGTMTNIFLVDEQGKLLTPSLRRNGVDGVCRQYILENATSWQLSVDEADVSLDMLARAREVFVANSVNGVWPVKACGRYEWPVGAVTRVIQSRVMDVLNA